MAAIPIPGTVVGHITYYSVIPESNTRWTVGECIQLFNDMKDGEGCFPGRFIVINRGVFAYRAAAIARAQLAAQEQNKQFLAQLDAWAITAYDAKPGEYALTRMMSDHGMIPVKLQGVRDLVRMDPPFDQLARVPALDLDLRSLEATVAKIGELASSSPTFAPFQINRNAEGLSNS
jgi:hypothetical protein